jgi:glycosyltransferase involved in cell wall biosynthesis
MHNHAISEAPRSSADISCVFINPHSHHSYFTVLALSQVFPVVLICPPLQLQLIQGRWKTRSLRLKNSSFSVTIAQLKALIAFFLYKLKLSSEAKYVLRISDIATSMLSPGKRYVFVHYQDYISIHSRAKACKVFDICEMIISIKENTENYDLSLNAASLADVVVCPSSAMASILSDAKIKCLIAPYGGNKAHYMGSTKNPQISQLNHSLKTPYTFLVAARANSHRKGFDLLLEALKKLDKTLYETHASIHIDVKICGAIASQQDVKSLAKTNELLRANNLISVSAQQYGQQQYLSLISNADLFVLPSRLEGTSPAALEALSLGIPCILSKECGVDSFEDGKHGALLSSLTSDCLSNELYNMICSPDSIKRIRLNLAADNQLFSWDRYLVAYSEILSQLASSGEV